MINSQYLGYYAIWLLAKNMIKEWYFLEIFFYYFAWCSTIYSNYNMLIHICSNPKNDITILL